MFSAEPNVLRVVRQQPAAVEFDTGLGQRFHTVRQLDQFERLDVQVFRTPRLVGRSHFPVKTPFQRQRPHRNKSLRINYTLNKTYIFYVMLYGCGPPRRSEYFIEKIFLFELVSFFYYITCIYF